jgi:photosystem II stability/assembly factor-like uncharacterized protein
MRTPSVVTIALFIVLLPFCTVAQFRQIAVLGDFISSFATDSSSCYAASYSGGLYRSTDGGASWNLLNKELAHKGILSLLIRGTSLYVGTSGSGVYKSNDSGVTVTPINQGLFLPIEIYSLASTDSSIYAGSYGQGIYRSSGCDDQWHPTSAAGLILSIATRGSKVFAASNEGGIYRSLDDGHSWTFADSGLANMHIGVVAFDGHRVYAASNGYGIIDEFHKTSVTIGYEVFVSTDNGDTWAIAFDNSFLQRVICFTFLGGSSGDSLIAVGTPSGVFVSTNPGTTWTDISAGLPNESTFAIALQGSYLIVGTYSGGVSRRPLSEILTSVRPPPAEAPTELSLSQNYPNPFNLTTEIGFRLPAGQAGIEKGGFVTLKVYDALGREVTTLVNQELSPGYYRTAFVAAKVASGVYFYRLSTRATSGQQPAFTETRKMILLK